MRTYILRAVISILAEMKHDLLLPELRIEFSHRESALELNGLILNCGVRGMLKGMNCRPFDMVFPIEYGFIDHVTGRTSLQDV